MITIRVSDKPHVVYDHEKFEVLLESFSNQRRSSSRWRAMENLECKGPVIQVAAGGSRTHPQSGYKSKCGAACAFNVSILALGIDAGLFGTNVCVAIFAFSKFSVLSAHPLHSTALETYRARPRRMTWLSSP